MRGWGLTCWLLLVAPQVMPGAPASTETFELRRSRAVKLAHDRAAAAAPALQALLKEKPGDAAVLLELALFTAAKGRELEPNSTERRAAMKRAHAFLVEAKQAGSTEPILNTALGEIDGDGVEHGRVFATNAAAQQEIAKAEQAFAANNFQVAQAHYQAALALEPSNYAATLYLGDTYFVLQDLPRALEIFQQATKLDSNREIGYRYAGDALLRLGRKDDALEQYLSAVVAEPYSGYPWKALDAGCRVFLLKPWPMAAALPVAKVVLGEKGPRIELSHPNDPAQISYSIARAKWQTENKAMFPRHEDYRQSLAEELVALETLLAIFHEFEVAPTPTEKEVQAWAPYTKALRELAEVQKAGLLREHILFFRANVEVAQDYAAYREQHRAELRSYLVKFYLHLP